MGECPVCGAEIEIAKNSIAGELVICGDCGVELELLETNPVELAEAPSAEEDWGQ